eukprot:1502551-Rhodomonas_salina.1
MPKVHTLKGPPVSEKLRQKPGSSTSTPVPVQKRHLLWYKIQYHASISVQICTVVLTCLYRGFAVVVWYKVASYKDSVPAPLALRYCLGHTLDVVWYNNISRPGTTISTTMARRYA